MTPPERLERIDRAADGFLYLVAHQGITGVRDGDFGPVIALVEGTVARVKNPVCVGFGLSFSSSFPGSSSAFASPSPTSS